MTSSTRVLVVECDRVLAAVAAVQQGGRRGIAAIYRSQVVLIIFRVRVIRRIFALVSGNVAVNASGLQFRWSIVALTCIA